MPDIVVLVGGAVVSNVIPDTTKDADLQANLLKDFRPLDKISGTHTGQLSSSYDAIKAGEAEDCPKKHTTASAVVELNWRFRAKCRRPHHVFLVTVTSQKASERGADVSETKRQCFGNEPDLCFYEEWLRT